MVIYLPSFPPSIVGLWVDSLVMKCHFTHLWLHPLLSAFKLTVQSESNSTPISLISLVIIIIISFYAVRSSSDECSVQLGDQRWIGLGYVKLTELKLGLMWFSMWRLQVKWSNGRFDVRSNDNSTGKGQRVESELIRTGGDVSPSHQRRRHDASNDGGIDRGVGREKRRQRHVHRVAGRRLQKDINNPHPSGSVGHNRSFRCGRSRRSQVAAVDGQFCRFVSLAPNAPETSN